MGKVLLLIALALTAWGIYEGWLPGRGALAQRHVADQSQQTNDWVYKQNTCRMSRHNVQQLEQAERSGADVWSLHGDQKKLSRAEIYAALEENRRLITANCTR